MTTRPTHRFAARRTLAVLAIALSAASGSVAAADVPKGIEQALVQAQQDKRGITLYVGGQTIGGAVTKVEPGQWVELRNQTMSRIVVRIDRIDAIAAP
jgi:putative heme degradation protein